MRTARILLLILVLILLMFVGLCSCARQEAPSAFAVEEEVVRIASGDTLWPGYDPLAIPLAIYDGANTYLFRHPSPPEDFLESGGVHVFEGRYPDAVANASAHIGGIWTATLLLEPPLVDRPVTEIAAVGLHEAFHVFQRSTERSWGADETHLFLYPVDDADALTLRRVETEALRRAFASQDADEIAGWAQSALDARKERFGRIDAPFAAYERGIELSEGTAMYVEYKAAGRVKPEFPSDGFGPEDVRRRAYFTGAAFALLLDRFDPNWRDGFVDDNSRHLDTDLAEALRAAQASRVSRELDGSQESGGSRLPSVSQQSTFSESELSDFARAARTDVDALLVDRARQRTQFESAPGWRLIVEADEAAPLWPQGFDPMNVRRVEGGLLHTRFLKLGNEAGHLEVMGDTVLTQGPGPHPLFNGVQRLVLTGLESEPVVDVHGEEVTVTLPTFNADFHGAVVERSDAEVYVRLGQGVSGD